MLALYAQLELMRRSGSVEIDPHAVVSQIGAGGGGQTERFVVVDVLEVHRTAYREGVVTASRVGPRVVVRGHRAREAQTYLYFVMFLPYALAFGAGAGGIVILGAGVDTLHLLLELHLLARGFRIVLHRELRHGAACRQHGREGQQNRKSAHIRLIYRTDPCGQDALWEQSYYFSQYLLHLQR